MVGVTRDYNKSHAWQYDIRINNYEIDLKKGGLTKEEVNAIRVSDFKFAYVSKEDKKKCNEIKTFIKCHEWLGKMPNRPTHRFIATYNDQLAGVIVMATPNSFSNLLGKQNRDLEKLISRGACISWSPKNLASALLMYSIRWMVDNTTFRFFTAYADVEARELGTIYQACNFIYLGDEYGTRFEYYDPEKPAKGWFSDRAFRKTSKYRRYAKLLGIKWESHWGNKDKIAWNNIPGPICAAIKTSAKEHQKRCIKRVVPKKHKYLYILGIDNRETKYLRALFLNLNPQRANLEYPKNRGPINDTASLYGI